MHFPLNVISKKPLQFSNMIVEDEKSGEICDRDGCHLLSSFEIKNNSYPQTIHDLVQASKCDSTILKSSRTC